MKKLLIVIFCFSLVPAFATDYGSFVIKSNDFKELFNKYRVAAPNNTPWVGSWWAFRNNGTTYNGMYRDTTKLGPTQKFDQIYDLGTASTDWEKENNTCDKQEDEELKKSCKGWWGHCNAWAGAAIKEPEPRKSFLTRAENGEEFHITVADQKAYLTEMYMEDDSLFVGKRVNEKVDEWVWDPEHETSKKLIYKDYPDAGNTYDAFWDITPKTFFMIFTNYVGVRSVGLVIDRFTGSQVWNQPIAGYRILPIKKSDIQEPEEREGIKVYPVKISMKMFWAEDGVGELEVSKHFDINKTNDDFKFEEHINKHYSARSLSFFMYFDAPMVVSEDGKTITSVGKMVGDGVWYHQTKEGSKLFGSKIKNTHPDFIWMPQAPKESQRKRSKPPAMTAERIRKIFKNNITPERLTELDKPLIGIREFKDKQNHILNYFKEDQKTADNLITLKKSAFNLIKKAEDFLTIMEPGTSKPFKLYLNDLNKLVEESLETFFKTDPTIEDFSKLQRLLFQISTSDEETVNIIMKLKEKSFSLIKTPAEFLKLIDFGSRRPSKTYISSMGKFIKNKIPEIIKMGPSLNDLMQLQTVLFEIQNQDSATLETIMVLKKESLKLLKTAKEYVYLLVVGIRSPKVDVKVGLENFIYENIETFIKLAPSIPEVLQIHRILFYVETDTEKTAEIVLQLKVAAIPLAKGFHDYVNLMDLGTQKPIKSYKEKVKKLLSENPYINPILDFPEDMTIKEFLARQDKVFKTNSSMEEKIELIIELKSKTLNFVKESKDFTSIFGLGTENPDSEYLKKSANLLKENLEIFVKTNPGIDQILDLELAISKLATSKKENNKFIIQVKKRGLDQVHDTVDFIKLHQLGESYSDNELSELVLGMLSENIEKYFTLNPTLSHIYELQGHIIKLGGKSEKLENLLIKLKTESKGLAKSYGDYLKLMDLEFEAPSDGYKEKIALLLKDNPYENPIFVVTDDLTVEEFLLRQKKIEKEFSSNSGKTKGLFKLKERFLRIANRPDDLLKIILPGSFKGSASYLNSLNDLLTQNREKYFSFGPSIKEIIKLQDAHKKVSTNLGSTEGIVLEIKKRGLQLVDNIQKFMDLLDLGEFGNPSGNLKSLVFNFASENISIFVGLGPSIQQVLELQSQFVNLGGGLLIDTIIKLKRATIHLATRFQEYLNLMDFGMSSPSDFYRAEIEKLLGENPFDDPNNLPVPDAVANTTFEEYILIHKKYLNNPGSQIGNKFKHKTEGLGLMNNPDQMIELCSFNISNPDPEYKELLNDFISSNLEEMVKKVSPTVIQLRQLTKFSTNVDTKMAIMKAGLGRLQYSAELVTLVEPMTSSPSDEYLNKINEFILKSLSIMVEKASPSVKELMLLAGYSNSIEMDIAIRKAGVAIVKSREDYLELIKPLKDNHSDEYLYALNDFIKENPYEGLNEGESDLFEFRCTYELFSSFGNLMDSYTEASFKREDACSVALNKCNEMRRFFRKCKKK